jgi:hypothetical protein
MRCSMCLLEDTVPSYGIDHGGVCKACRTNKKITYKDGGEARLIKILDEQKERSKNSKYDCVVGISGGRDSSYTILKMVRDYNMRVLAVNYDNPFTDPQAITNMEHIVDTLGVDLVKFKLPRHIHERTFKNNLLAWARNPQPSMIPMICIACKTMMHQTIKIARKNHVTCQVLGGNFFEETSFKKELLNVKDDEFRESSIIEILPGVIEETLKNPRYFHLVCLPVMAEGYFFTSPYSIGSRVYGRNINRIDLFHYIPWDEKEIISRISRELGWESPKKLSSTWRFDCRVSHLKDFMYMKTIGMTEKDDFYSRMIREGILDREEGLKRLEVENKIYYDEIDSVLRLAGIEGLSELYRINPKLQC